MIPNIYDYQLSRGRILFLMMALLISCGQKQLIAQIPLIADGQTRTIHFDNDDKVQEYMLPSYVSSGRIFFETFGGDGGKKIGNGGNTRAKGGQGAQIGAWFEIGNGNGKIPPGATILFIPGEHGQNRKNGSATGTGGGGGSAVFYQRANGDWTLLQVAGGGRGGAADCCTVELDGYPGEAYSCVIIGHGAEGTNSHCHYGDVILPTLCDAGGSAIYDNIDQATGGTTYQTNDCNFCRPGKVGWPGATSIPTNSVKPTGGFGGGYNYNGTPCVTNDRKGGFGFGGGAAGGPGAGIGGGGSGGGFTAHIDRGGGSYLNESMAMDDQPQHRIKRSATSDPQHGRTKYTIITPPVAICNDLIVTLPISGQMSLLLSDFTTSSYTLNNSEILITQNVALSDISELFSLNLDCSDIGTQTVLVRVTGSISELTSTCTANLTVLENSPPEISCSDISLTTDPDGTLSLSLEDIPYTVDNGCSDAMVFELDTDEFSYNCDLNGQSTSETVTLTATDQQGNSASCTSLVTVNVNLVDNLPPTALCAPVSVQLDGQGEVSVSAMDLDAGSTDLCGITSYQLLAPNVHLEIKGDRYVREVAWQINSLDGNTTYAFEDRFTLPAIISDVSSVGYSPTHFFRDITLEEGCYNFLWDDYFLDGFLCALEGETLYYKVIDDDGNVLAYDECEGIGNGGTTEICVPAPIASDALTFSCDDVGQHLISLQLTDEAGNKSLCTTTITVDYTAPLCSPIVIQLPAPDAQVQVNANQLVASAADECGNNLPAYFAKAKLQLEIESDGWNQDMSWEITNSDNTVIYAQGGAFPRDHNLNREEQITHFVVDIPYIESGNLDFHWNDSFGDGFLCDTPGEYYYSLKKENGTELAYGECQDIGQGQSTNIGQVNITGAGYIYTIEDKVYNCEDAGLHYVTVGVLLSNNSLQNCETTIQVNPPPPVAICQDITVQLNTNGKHKIEAEDINNNSLYPCGGYQRLSVDKENFRCEDVGTTIVTLTAADNYGGSSTCTATVTVQDTIAPQALCKDLTIQIDAASTSVTVTPNQIDNGSNDLCGIAFTDGYSLSKSEFSCADVGQNTVTMTVADVGGNTASCTSSVTVEDIGVPNAICKNVVVQLDENGQASITSDDVNQNSSDLCGIASMTLDNTSFDCVNTGSANSVTLTVTDVNGNEASCSAMVTVEDNIPPEVSCYDLTIPLNEEGNSFILGVADIVMGMSDACGIQNMSLDITSFSCNDVGNNTVTLTVVDAGGNTSSCESNVIVEDITPPVALCHNLTVQLDAEGNSFALGVTNIDKGSTDACGIQNQSLSQTSFSCLDVGNNIITLTVMDVNGNTSSCNANVLVEDNIAPLAICQDVTVELDENGEGTITPEQMGGHSNDACGIESMSLNTTTFSCSEVGTNQTLTLSITDNNGNISTCQASVSVEDHSPPNALCQDVVIELDAAGDGILSVAEVNNNSFDNCQVASMSLSQTQFSCDDLGGKMVILTVTDVHGNVSTCDAHIETELSGALAAGWTANDIGQVTLGNDYWYDPCADPPTYYVTGSGNNTMNMMADHIAFMAYSTCEDFTFTAKVESVDPNGYGGLMVRENMEAGSKQVALFSNMSNILRHEVRYSTNTPKQVGSFYTPNPMWLRIDRQGDWIFSYSSYDGINFQYVHGVFIQMATCLEVGLVSFTYMPGSQTETVFSNVYLSGSNGGFSNSNPPISNPTNQLTNSPTPQFSNSPTNQPTLNLYPNPASFDFNIALETALDQMTTFQLFNAVGQLVDTHQMDVGATRLSWDISRLPDGIYWLHNRQLNTTEQLIISR